jgi:hypothetical protein
LCLVVCHRHIFKIIQQNMKPICTSSLRPPYSSGNVAAAVI